MSKRELKYIKSTNYGSKVLIGPWFEDSCSYKKYYYDHTSAYSRHYPPKPLTTIDQNVLWDARLKNNESVLSRSGGDASFLENFSTLYDLSYNHFPKVYKEHIPRSLRFRLEIHEPNDDYLRSFGNITRYGILDNKREQWRCEKQDPRVTYTTDYRDTFSAPNKESYKFKRWATPLPNSSSLYRPNTQNIDWKLRGTTLNNIPPMQEHVISVPKPRYNPITWECPVKEACNYCK